MQVQARWRSKAMVWVAYRGPWSRWRPPAGLYCFC